MKAFKKIMALLLVFVLIAACVPLGTITAFAAENEETILSAVEAETETEPEDTAEPTETQNESAPPTDESVGGEPEEESLTEASKHLNIRTRKITEKEITKRIGGNLK